MKLRSKFMLGIFVSVTVAMLVLILVVGYYVDRMTASKETDYNRLLNGAVQAQMDAQLASARMSVLTISNNSQVQQLFAARDRAALTSQLLPVFETLKKEVAQIQFHLPDSTAFLRLHMPAKFGDSLKSFRFTVNEANAKQTIVEGLEEGVGGYGFRVVVPMYNQGVHTGSVEYGSNFGKSFLQQLKASFAGEYFIYSFTTKIADGKPPFIAGTAEADAWALTEAQIAPVKSGEMQPLISADKNESILLIPYRNYQGNVAGYIKAVTDRSVIVSYDRLMNLVLYGVTALVAVMLALLMFVLLTRSVLQPLTGLQQAIAQVELGDFTVQCPETSKDEIGTLATSFNQMVRTVRDILQQVKGAIAEMTSSAGALQKNARESNQVTEEVARAVDEIARGATEQASNTEDGSSKTQGLGKSIESSGLIAEQVADSSQTVLVSVQQGLAELGELVRIYRTAAKAMTDVSDSIRQTDNSALKIGQASQVIASIAQQTNLLALNAAIESARAGEAGRGFAVVADQIRKLAEESTASTSTIDAVVGELGANSRKAVQTVESSLGALKELDREIEVSSERLRNIATATDETQQRTQALMQAAAEMEKMKVEILLALQGLAAIAEENSAATQQVSASVQEQSVSVREITGASEQLSGLAERLRQMVGRFKS